jgi:hypothetical protein
MTCRISYMISSTGYNFFSPQIVPNHSCCLQAISIITIATPLVTSFLYYSFSEIFEYYMPFLNTNLANHKSVFQISNFYFFLMTQSCRKIISIKNSHFHILTRKNLRASQAASVNFNSSELKAASPLSKTRSWSCNRELVGTKTIYMRYSYLTTILKTCRRCIGYQHISKSPL